MKVIKNPLLYLSLILTVAVTFLVWNFVQAQSTFLEPATTFPISDVNAPLDTGDTPQNKNGKITFGIDVSIGPLGIISDTITAEVYYDKGDPTYYLDLKGDDKTYSLVVAGQVKIGGGSPAVGKVLTSDANGLASWITPAVTDESTIEGYIANDVSTGYVPYDNGTKLISSNIFYDGANVGIGATDPGAYRLYIQGIAFSSGGWEASDIRLKKNIVQLNGALDKLGQLRGVTYEWRSTEFPERGLPTGRHIGLIAQEVEKLFPELVNIGPDGYKALAYDRVVAILIEAVKEQQAQIDELRAQLEAR